MKVKVIKKFNDVTDKGKRRKVDDILEVSEERGKKLIKDGYAVEEKTTTKKSDVAEKEG